MWFPDHDTVRTDIYSEFDHFCRPLIKCVFCLLITLNDNLGFFCMTDNHKAECYHRENPIDENTGLRSFSLRSLKLNIQLKRVGAL